VKDNSHVIQEEIKPRKEDNAPRKPLKVAVAEALMHQKTTTAGRPTNGLKQTPTQGDKRQAARDTEKKTSRGQFLSDIAKVQED